MKMTRWSDIKMTRKVVWRKKWKCPRCGKEAWFSSVSGYINVLDGYKVFCPHCEYTETG